jgi:hypothetical protein
MGLQLNAGRRGLDEITCIAVIGRFNWWSTPKITCLIKLVWRIIARSYDREWTRRWRNNSPKFFQDDIRRFTNATLSASNGNFPRGFLRSWWVKQVVILQRCTAIEAFIRLVRFTKIKCQLSIFDETKIVKENEWNSLFTSWRWWNETINPFDWSWQSRSRRLRTKNVFDPWWWIVRKLLCCLLKKECDDNQKMWHLFKWNRASLSFTKYLILYW